jgi:hypothetical protein
LRYLTAGGLLIVGSSLEEHVDQLARAMREGPDLPAVHRFVQSLVRPRGFDVPSTPLVVAAIERLGRDVPAAPSNGPWWVALGRRARGMRS